MPDENKKQSAHQALVHTLLDGPGTTPPDLRVRAFNRVEVPESLHPLLAKVADRPTQVSDADLVAAKASGYSEDQIFELVICAAVGQATRQYESGLAALAEAKHAS